MKIGLTAPEMYTERAQGKQKLELINEVGRCRVCVNRAGKAWGRGYCVTNGRSYPLCARTPGLTFELDRGELHRIVNQRSAALKLPHSF